MATYKEIQSYVKDKYNTSIKTCWIADMKEYHGLKMRVAPNRISMDSKTYPCPEDKKEMITDAFKQYGML
ncbi:RNA methyltransferase [Vallitalea guaymasensis]|uniref:RNA methyltransferase n=1 Tax=Vallitalea guaymasensis TaxID=1185412 RepID=A0A8J8ME42_9FIRM|nr:RNA methyltransferase [Vallitalea guaymasensis]QUH31138.1 hypothetical protein HYG85_20320 [Vallitalea guaymasensis]